MKTILDFKVGDTIKVTHNKFPNCVDTYIIENTDIKNDGRGQIELSTIERINPNYMPQKHSRGKNVMVVDKLWFDEQLTGRKIIKL